MPLQKLFDPAWYLKQNPDVAEAVAQGLMTAWQHFEQFGQHEGRAPLKWFDAELYLSQNPDVAQAARAGHTSAVHHFAQHGATEARLLAPTIDLGAYLRANPDVAEAVASGLISALGHLVQHGVHESRDLGNGISLDVFAGDPVFQAAQSSGDVAAVLARIDAVGPFLPEFVAPQAWEPAADMPIPVDFVPPVGSDLKLVVPAGVKVPQGQELPAVFEPVEPGQSGGSGGGSPGGSNGGSGDGLPAPMVFKPMATTTEGSSDASTALALDGGFMVVADDEGAILRVYDRKGGVAVKEWSIAEAAAAKGDTALGEDEIDLEAGTRIGDTFFFTGSHSNSRSGGEANEREFLFSVKLNGTGAATEFELRDIQDGLEGLLAAWDDGNAHGKGAGYFGLAASSVGGVVPEQVGGFSIEGMTASLDDSQLLLGFRAPQADTQTREKALIVPVSVATVFSDTPAFGEPIDLNLGGRGIRSIEKDIGDTGYLILAGPASPSSDVVTHDFRLYRWDGGVEGGEATGLEELEIRDHNGTVVSLDSLLAATGGSFESLVEVTSLVAGTRVQLLQDNGDTIWEGQTKVSKDLDEADQQFVGNWITLGDVAANAEPSLAASNIGEGAVIGNKANLVLHFDEAVKWGDGSIVLKKAGEAAAAQTFDAASERAVLAYNVLTLDPADDLDAGDYVLEFMGDAIQDLTGLAPSDPISSLAFTVHESEPHRLSITEVSSNNGQDFFEIYNYGIDDIDLGGWKWVDNTANPDDGDFGVFADGTTIKAGSVLVVAADTTSIDSLKTQWTLSDAVSIVAVGGKGLGGGDAVLLYDSQENLATALNYGTVDLTALDGTVIAPITGSAGGHTGLAVGGTTGSISAVWDGISSFDAPIYIPATDLPGTPLGTPGVAAYSPYSLLITEVNSNAEGGDFFEIYNYGDEDVVLTGWKWLDDTTDPDADDFGVFEAGTTVKAGEVLIVAASATSVDTLKAAWGGLADVDVVAVGGNGLGGGDAVRVYDADQKLVTAFNYGSEAITSLEGTVIAPIYGSEGGHAGAAVGATNAVSAIWDGGSVHVPVYVAATQMIGSSPYGTPGVVEFTPV